MRKFHSLQHENIKVPNYNFDAKRKAKVIWNCRRGMLELDLLLSGFLQKQQVFLSFQDWYDLEQLLMLDDPSLYAQLMGYEPSTQALCAIVDKIKANTINKPNKSDE